ncbi:MAG: hypothetical protein V4590_08890 [Bacteroidota bacterium]
MHLKIYNKPIEILIEHIDGPYTTQQQVNKRYPQLPVCGVAGPP